jgi:hypothetical protein
MGTRTLRGAGSLLFALRRFPRSHGNLPPFDLEKKRFLVSKRTAGAKPSRGDTYFGLMVVPTDRPPPPSRIVLRYIV